MVTSNRAFWKDTVRHKTIFSISPYCVAVFKCFGYNQTSFFIHLVSASGINVFIHLSKQVRGTSHTPIQHYIVIQFFTNIYLFIQNRQYCNILDEFKELI